MSTILEARQEIVKYSHKVQQYGYVSATDGNLSIRLDDNRVLITPSGLEKGEMTLEAPIIIDMDGNKLEGEGKPSSEGKMHLEVFKLRPDVRAVIHAHPPKCIAFTIAGQPIDTCLLPEVVVTLGAIPTSRYATPTTNEVPESIRDYIMKSDAVMLSRHGSLTVGKDLKSAFKILEKMEHSATISLYARLLGGPVPFSQNELQKLYNLRQSWGVTDAPLDCADAGSCSVQPAQRLSEAGAPSNTCKLYAIDESTAGAGAGAMQNTNNELPDGIDMNSLVEMIVEKVKQQMKVS